ncbi:MAG: ATP-binding cassette domain-containing protein [Desulfobacterales bacterium]|nr:ATP-binding cassette domain-containing protein [Desulfobacterales bacterium]MDX2512754.1 ATP-binding cassette domain-containing protein [Desulfobacterales bacterium]
MIHVENLTKYYHDFCAVDNFNLDVHKGEVLGMLGPNGAGKTTFMRMLTGFLKPSEGTIRVKELSMESDALDVKKLMGYLPESAPLYKDMLAYDYLLYVAGIRGIRDEKIAARIRYLSDLCGLNNMIHKPIGELSKGYKQRVGLAHAMMGDPEILILDEPTSGLDPNQIVEIRDIIRQIGKEKTVILSTHILSEAEATCDRVVIVHKGKIAADDRTENLKVASDQENHLNLSIHNADPEAVRTLLEGVEGVQQVNMTDAAENALSIKLSCESGRDVRGPVYLAIKDTDWVLTELTLETQTLESIFRQITLES